MSDAAGDFIVRLPSDVLMQGSSSTGRRCRSFVVAANRYLRPDHSSASVETPDGSDTPGA